MADYRKRPVVIQAEPVSDLMGWAASTWMHMPEWVRDAYEAGTIVHEVGTSVFAADHIVVRTLEGPMRASRGDMLIRGVKGELYPCKPDVFALTYDLA